jgi:uncharacterized protein YcfJ
LAIVSASSIAVGYLNRTEFTMKILASTALFTALALSGVSSVEAQRLVETRMDRARVVDVDPVYGQRRGRLVQECWNERVGRYDSGYYRDDSGRLYRDRDDGTAGAVIGALVGGALGNQVGDGRGRTAATVAGAVIGSRVGKDIDEDDHYRYRGTSGNEVRCRTTQTAGRGTRGYRVTYVYAGQPHRTFMRSHPGRTIPVEVTLRHGRRGRTIVTDVRPTGNAYVADQYDWRD